MRQLIGGICNELILAYSSDKILESCVGKKKNKLLKKTASIFLKNNFQIIQD